MPIRRTQDFLNPQFLGFAKAFLITLMICILQTSCSESSPKSTTPGSPGAQNSACASGSASKPYLTVFPLEENPICENGSWVDGQSAGSSLWGNVRTGDNMAFGVSEPTQFGDPTAILTGSWGPNQTVSGTVKINSTPFGTCCHEVELRLRTTISTNSITGYEAYCSVMPDNPYCHIARWNGPNASYCKIESLTPTIYTSDGDVLTATVTGANPTVITMYKNGTEVMQATDTGQNCNPGGPAGPFMSGSPGIGFYDDQDSYWIGFGFSNFSAHDNVQNR